MTATITTEYQKEVMRGMMKKTHNLSSATSPSSPTPPRSRCGTTKTKSTTKREMKCRLTARQEISSLWANRAATTSSSSLPTPSSSSSSIASTFKKTVAPTVAKTTAISSKLWQTIPKPNKLTRRSKSLSALLPSELLSTSLLSSLSGEEIFCIKKINYDNDDSSSSDVYSEESTVAPTPPPTPPSPTTFEQNKTQLFQTLTNIKITSHLQSHLDTIAINPSQHYLKSVLSILPPGFDQTSACVSSSKNRNRAFVLLDLARVIWDHALFLSVTCGFGYGRSFGFQGVVEGLPPTHYQIRKNQFFDKMNCIRPNRSSSSSSSNRSDTKPQPIYIQPQFRVTKNPNIELLKLLIRLGVDLRCNTSDDVVAASRALVEEQRERYTGSDNSNSTTTAEVNYCAVVVDDATHARKPDGYFRRLLSMNGGTNRTGGCQLEVAVDDSEEVTRVSKTIRRIRSRKSLLQDTAALEDTQNSTVNEPNQFILCLPIMTTNINSNSVTEFDANSTSLLSEVMNEDICQLILNVHATANKEGGELVGVSIDLSPWGHALQQSLVDDDDEENYFSETDDSLNSNIILMKLCAQLRLFRLIMVLVNQCHIRIDLTGLPDDDNFMSVHAPNLTRALTSGVTSDVTLEEVELVSLFCTKYGTVSTQSLETILQKANDPNTSSLVYTADVSDHLVARAGALCARIIGVKKSSETSNKTQKKDSVAMHYYIDDGCYGSLYLCPTQNSSTSCSMKPNSTTRKHMPEPLYGNRTIQRSPSFISHRDKHPIQRLDTSKYVNATVWGPTCDGIDRVCESVSLPSDLIANRDWLLFRNLGCGGFGGGFGLGTGFNGFKPPDVSYCALPSGLRHSPHR